MNMKTILTYSAVVILSLNVFTAQAREEPENRPNETALSQQESPDVLSAPRHVNSQTMTQTAPEQSSEAFITLCVYLLIIAVYSIYGFTAGAKNAETE